METNPSVASKGEWERMQLLFSLLTFSDYEQVLPPWSELAVEYRLCFSILKIRLAEEHVETLGRLSNILSAKNT